MLPGNHELGLRIGSFDAALGDPAPPTPENSPYPNLSQMFYQLCPALGTNLPFGGLDIVVALWTTAQEHVVFLCAAAVFVGDDAPDRLAVFGIVGPGAGLFVVGPLAGLGVEK